MIRKSERNGVTEDFLFFLCRIGLLGFAEIKTACVFGVFGFL